MAKLRPSLDDIFYRFKMDSDIFDACISAEAERMLRKLVQCSASRQVWTYSPPQDGGLPNDEKTLLRLSGGNRYLWTKYRDEVVSFFELRDGKYFLNLDWVVIRGRKIK